MRLQFTNFTYKQLYREVPNSCPDKWEHLKATLALGRAPEECTHEGVLNDPRIPSWFASPAGRHKRAMPRWGGMNLTPNGKVTSRMASEKELKSDKTIHDFDYADRTLIWG